MNRPWIRIIPDIFLVIFTCLTALFSCADSKKELTLGLVPSTTPAGLREEFEGIRSYLESEMGMAVTVLIPENYQSLISMMKSGEVDIALFGAFSYIIADSRQELAPLVVRSRKDMGVTYSSVIFTRADSGISSIEDLKGGDFAFVNSASTSGFMVPCSLFASRQIDMDSYFHSYFFADSHDKVLDAVLSGEADGGAMSTSILAGQIESGSLAESDLRVLWESDPIPGSPFVARGDLKQSIQRDFTEAMLSLHENAPEDLFLFSASVEKFVPAEPSLYKGVRNIIRVLGEDYIIEHGLE